MKYRIFRLSWLTVVLGLIAPPLMAERNLIPSLESIPDVCSERPNEPDWMENITLRLRHALPNLGFCGKHLSGKPCRCRPFRHAASLGHLQPPCK